MSDRPKPETAPLMHAAANDSIEAMFRMGCDLERQLAVAHSLFASSKRARKSLSDACDHLQRERDDARETLSDVRRAIGAGKNEGIRLAAMRVKAERDEALEQAAQLREKYRIHHEEAEKLTAEIAKVCEERDEASEQRDALAAALRQLAQPCTRSDYTIGDLDRVVCHIANTALSAVEGGGK